MPNTSDRKITHLVIDRSKWGTARLLRRDGTMCCLGHLAIKCGADESEILNETTPDRVPNINWPAAIIEVGRSPVNDKKKIIKNSKLADRMIIVNDDAFLPWADKERKLIPLFKKANIKLSFKGPPKKDKK